MNYSPNNDFAAFANAGPQNSRVETIITSVSRVSGLVILAAGFLGITLLILQ